MDGFSHTFLKTTSMGMNLNRLTFLAVLDRCALREDLKEICDCAMSRDRVKGGGLGVRKKVNG